VLAVRSEAGDVVHYPLVENVHHEGILRLSTAPAPAVDAALQRTAESYATRVMQELGYVGVLAIELFAANGALLANEMAPRVHNSGHWTIEGSETSQFENHVRAVCGLPLGETDMVGHAAMLNVIGTVPPLASLLHVPDVHVHLYGKSEAARRKLGHVTVRATSAETVGERVATLRRVLASY
jgi:5-(carboxyamino)imidazole ribonucleotide synthase